MKGCFSDEDISTGGRFSEERFSCQSTPVPAEVALGEVPVPDKFTEHEGEAARTPQQGAPWKWGALECSC